jgi:hypothetical protein
MHFGTVRKMAATVANVRHEYLVQESDPFYFARIETCYRHTHEATCPTT